MNRIPEEELNAISKRAEKASGERWYYEEDNDVWRLFAEYNNGFANLQIIKAPKHDTRYAEYWPEKDDAEFIAHARTDVPRLVSAYRELLAEFERLSKALWSYGYEGDDGGELAQKELIALDIKD